jgi:hypothetical protein
MFFVDMSVDVHVVVDVDAVGFTNQFISKQTLKAPDIWFSVSKIWIQGRRGVSPRALSPLNRTSNAARCRVYLPCDVVLHMNSLVRSFFLIIGFTEPILN